MPCAYQHLEIIMWDKLHEHNTLVSIEGRPLSNILRRSVGSRGELKAPTSSILASAHMEWKSAQTRTKLNINKHGNLSSIWTAYNLKKYRVSSTWVQHYGGIWVVDVQYKITAVRQDWTKFGIAKFSFVTKYKLYVPGCSHHAVWLGNVDLAHQERKIQVFETKCFRRLLRVSYKEHKTNEYVCNVIASLVSSQEPLLATMKQQKLVWFGHVVWHSSLLKTVLQGYTEGGWRGKQRKNWWKTS